MYKTYVNKRTLLDEKIVADSGLEPAIINDRPNALSTELCQRIKSTWFNLT